MSDMHEMIYADANRVREMRVQAQGRVAWRRIQRVLVWRWVEPMVAWIARRL